MSQNNEMIFMGKKTSTDSTAEIKNYRKQGRLVFGTRQTTQLLRDRAAEKVYLAVNCPQELRREIEHFGKLSDVPVLTLEILSDDLGLLCRRQHMVLVLGLRKE